MLSSPIWLLSIFCAVCRTVFFCKIRKVSTPLSICSKTGCPLSAYFSTLEDRLSKIRRISCISHSARKSVQFSIEISQEKLSSRISSHSPASCSISSLPFSTGSTLRLLPSSRRSVMSFICAAFFRTSEKYSRNSASVYPSFRLI